MDLVGVRAVGKLDILMFIRSSKERILDHH